MKRESVAPGWPSFDAPLLREIAAAFLRRRKAIAYHTGLCCEREFSESPASTLERLNLEAGALRLSVWADGAMWLAVCVRRMGGGGGWAFQDSFHGNVQDVSPEALVEMVEATLSSPFGVDTMKEREQLRSLWSRVRPYAG